MRGCGRLAFEDFSLDFDRTPFDATEGASGNLRISLVNRIHPPALSSVLQDMVINLLLYHLVTSY